MLAVAAVLLRPWEGLGGESERLPASAKAYVVRAVDGDTIQVRLGGRLEYVRYIGVDTPETVKPDTPVQCFGERASHFDHRLVSHRRVRLVLGAEPRDVYGRLLAYVYLAHGSFDVSQHAQGPQRLFNAILARRGLARPLTIPPNDRFAPRFEGLARAAARDGRGLWGAC